MTSSTARSPLVANSILIVVELDPSPLDSEPLRARGRQGAFAVLETAQVGQDRGRLEDCKSTLAAARSQGLESSSWDRVRLPWFCCSPPEGIAPSTKS